MSYMHLPERFPGIARRSRLLRLAAAAGLGAVLAAGSPALAQDGPTTRPDSPPEEMRARSPFWGADRYDSPRDRGRYEDEETFDENFPVDLAAQVAPARERYVALKLGYDMARRSLDDRVDELRRSLEDSEEYRQLRQEREEVEAALRTSREQALAPLMDDPQYQALVDLQRDLEKQIKAAHNSPDRSLEEIRGMSELAMIYGRQRREMESGLVDNDSSIDSGMQRLREINDRQRELGQELSRQIRNDEQLAAMRDQIEQLRVAYISAGAFYDSAVRTANIAADFAYYNSLANMGYGFGADPYAGYGYPYRGYGGGFGHGGHFGGFVVAGFPGPIPPGDGPIRLRPVLFPTPILSNTFRGINQATNFRPGAPGGSPPDIPPPDEE